MKKLATPSTVLTVLLLVSGCSGASFAPGSATNRAIVNSGSAMVRQKTGGGAFTAEYSGPYTFVAGCTATVNGRFKFSGSGHASYLHGSTESGKMTGKRHGSRCVWNGSATLTASRHPRNSVTFSLGLNGSQYHNPCSNAVGFVVKRGTGKFASASGNGTVTFSCGSAYYLDNWSGTLTF